MAPRRKAILLVLDPRRAKHIVRSVAKRELFGSPATMDISLYVA